MAVLMNQVTAKTKASRIIGVELRAGACDGSGALASGRGAAAAVLALARSSRFSGKPRSRCAAAQTKQAIRHPSAASRKAEIGQQMVLASPASRVMPVIALRAFRR